MRFDIAGLIFAAACGAAPVAAAPVAFVVLGQDGSRQARVLTDAAACLPITIDGHTMPMQLRAPAETVPLRPTRSSPAESKPSVFGVATCEATIPPDAVRAAVDGARLPLSPRIVRRIVIIGDTGCRLKASENAYQACGDPRAYPFATVAAAAARWRPDLVVHVGDYLYRENICPPDRAGCAGSPWGYGYDAWDADFFAPARPLLAAAPWVMIRGNHESCLRAGQGWWRMLDPRPLDPRRSCNNPADDVAGDYSDPYAVPLGQGAQIIVNDSAMAGGKPLAPGDPQTARFARAYAQIAALAARAPHSMLAEHHPLLGFAAHAKHGATILEGGNAALQSVWGTGNPRYVPPGVDLLLSGHVHVWEAVSFASDHPAQLVAGFSGTLEDIVPLPATVPPGTMAAPGAVAEALSSWVDGFGFMTMERRGAARWRVAVHDMAGRVVNTCRLDGRHLKCAKAQVASVGKQRRG